MTKQLAIDIDFVEYNRFASRQTEKIDRMLAGNVKPRKVLKAFYKIIDQTVRDWYPEATCKKGCSFCCHIPVGISGLEARFIEDNTIGVKATMENGPLADVRTPCVFLKDKQCTVYEFRPAVCRVFHSFSDPIHCEREESHQLLSLQYPGHGGAELLNSIYLKILKHYRTAAPELHVFNDIRNFFDETKY